MSKEFLNITDGTYTFSETDNPNIFYFSRNDKEIIEEINDEPIEFLDQYIFRKMFNGEITDACILNHELEFSIDRKTIRITAFGISDKTNEIPKKEFFLKRLFNFFKRK